MQFPGQVVIVTGAASGIGKELCRVFARQGASVGMIDRNEGDLDAFAQELRKAGVACAAAPADVRHRDRVHDAVGKIVGDLGAADIVIASAGICRASTVHDLAIADLEETIGVNFLGLVYTIESVLPSMLGRLRGQIVGISSMAGLRGIPYEPGYSASKAATAAYLESLRSELGPLGIAVTTVFPGYVKTPLLDEINETMGADMSSGRAASKEAVAASIVRAIRKRSAYAYFPIGLSVGVRLSQMLPPELYDLMMRSIFGRFPISKRGAP